MKTFVAMTALAAIVAIPTLAGVQAAQAQTYSKEQSTPQKVKKAKVVQKKVQRQVVRSGSPYSTNPAHDVYVNGVYVGSDPDWRVRWTLKKEYCEESVDGC